MEGNLQKWNGMGRNFAGFNRNRTEWNNILSRFQRHRNYGRGRVLVQSYGMDWIEKIKMGWNGMEAEIASHADLYPDESMIKRNIFRCKKTIGNSHNLISCIASRLASAAAVESGDGSVR